MIFPQKIFAGIVIDQDIVWDFDQVIDSKVEIFKGKTLTIKAGTKISMKKGGNFRVYGSLITEGTKENPVVFTREKIGNTSSFWAYYFVFYKGSFSRLDNTIIERVGGLDLSGNVFNGLEVIGKLEVYNTLFREGEKVINVSGQGDLFLENCDFSSTKTFALRREDNSSIVKASNNYWNSDDGPYHSYYNPSSAGEKIQGWGIEFMPWKVKGKKPIMLVPGLGESLNFKKFFQEQEDGEWFLFPPNNSISALKNVFLSSGYEENKNLFISFYDWRKTFSFNAENYLQPKIKEAILQSDFKELDLIAFSFGGLVSRSYLQGENFDYRIKNFISIGTPHWGSSKIYTFLEGGILPSDWDPSLYLYLWFKGKEGFSLQEIRQEFPSIYEVMPVYDFLRNSSISDDVINYRQMAFVNERLEQLNQEEQLGLLKVRTNPFFIGGSGINTLEIIPVESFFGDTEGHWLDGIPDPLIPLSDSDKGDGTVLLKSSFFESSEIMGITLDKISHSDLPVNSITQIENLLDINLEENKNYPNDYIILVFASPLDVLLENNAGDVLSRENNSIEGAYYFEESVFGKKIILVYNPEESYKVKLRGLKEDKYRFLTFLKEGEYIKKDDLSSVIFLDEQVDYLVYKEFEIINDGQKILSQVKILEEILPDYKMISNKIVGYYKKEGIKTWETRQKILEKSLLGYNFLENKKPEGERLLLEELVMTINELLESKLIGEKEGDALKTVLNKLK